jgi:hypothetical protein
LGSFIARLSSLSSLIFFTRSFNVSVANLVGSGLGEASTVKTASILDGIDDSEIKFNQSTIGTTTKKALETASSRIVSRMIKKGVFKS